ncbi:MAG: helix-turn-helix domain-containing protein [Eubacteriales bacterium]
MKKNFIFNDYILCSDIKNIRNKLNLTQTQFAEFVGVSVKTIERWEYTEQKITGPIVSLVKLLNDMPVIIDDYHIPPRTLPLRLWYMFKHETCTIIDVDDISQKIEIHNYTPNIYLKAFGANETPSYEDYQAFLASRCFPPQRDKMKIILKDLELPFYDPFLIIKKTNGRMTEDDFWIKIES